MKRIVLAHAGGLETSAAIPWLAEKHRAEVVTVTLDLGQGGSLDDVHERALALGAARAHVLDVREEFARDFMLSALQAEAPGTDPSFVRALSRAVIAKHLVTIAHIEEATIVAYGGSESDDRASLGTLLRSLDPSIKAMRLAHAQGAASEMSPDLERRRDARLPDLPAHVDLAFEQGVPVAINGVDMTLVDLIQCLETIAGAHGLHEGPSAVPLHLAHADLQRTVTSPAVQRQMAEVAGRYAELVDAGLWHTPAREALDAVVRPIQEHVTGAVRLCFHKGDCRVVGRTAASVSPALAEASQS